MVLFPEHRPNHSDPVSIDLDPQLIELDARLQDAAREQKTPVGLADRVYAASVSLLPVAPVYQFRCPRSGSQARWMRAALAACVGMSVLVGSWFMTGPFQHPVEPARHLALVHEHPAVPVAVLEVENITELSAYAEAVLFDDLDYLTDTHDVTFDDLNGEIDRLLAHNDI